MSPFGRIHPVISLIFLPFFVKSISMLIPWPCLPTGLTAKFFTKKSDEFLRHSNSLLRSAFWRGICFANFGSDLRIAVGIDERVNLDAALAQRAFARFI